MQFKHPKKLKRTLAGLISGVFMTLLLLFIPQEFLSRAEFIFYDAFSEYKSDHFSEHSDDIYIVDIDENALAKYGPYNEWTREMHAKVVKRLEEGGAAAIAFDILFKNADFGSRNADRAEAVLQGLYPDRDWQGDYEKIRAAYDSDSILVRTVAENPNVVICGTFSSRTDYKHQSQWKPLSTPLRAKEIDAQPTFSLEQADAPEKIEQKDLLDNVFSALSHASKNFGVANATPDPDGVLRRMQLFYRFPNAELWPSDTGKIYPIFSISTLMHLFQTPTDSVRIWMGKYIDLGKPFGVYRDSSGALRTTYPQITYPMIRSVIRNARLLSSRPKNDSLAESFIEITPQIRAVKDSSGNLSILTDEGDFEMDDEELSDYDKESIAAAKKDLSALAAGKSLWLSAELDFHFEKASGRWVPNFSILSPDVLDEIYRADTLEMERLRPGEEMRFGERKRLPIDDRGNFLLNFRSAYNIPPAKRTFGHLSYYDVIEGRIPPETYQGKIFILGSAAPAMFDFYATPHEDHFPAVLVHATLLDNALKNDYARSKYPNAILYAASAVIAILIGLFASQYLAPVFLILFFLLEIAVSSFVFSRGLYIGCSLYLIEGVLAFFGSFLVRFYFENRDKTFLDKSFKQYISDKLIDEMLLSEKEPELGGEKKYLTAFFTDIQSFSSLSEQIGDPKKLVDLLNDYLTAMTDIIKDENQGTLDKYEGDAIIAFFGAPSPISRQRKHALESALSMQRMQRMLRENWKAHKNHRGHDLPKSVSFPESVFRMHTRIGINSGEILVGNMGSATRKNYTIMGDSVNLASRLESIGKQYGTYILVSEETLVGKFDPEDKTDYRSEFVTRPIDRLKVVGKSEAVQVYEVLCHKDDAEAGQMKLLAALWKKAQDFYYALDLEHAAQAFEETKLLEPHLHEKDPGAKPTPSEVFLLRTKEYMEHPPVKPGETWDGVYTATSK